MLSVQSFYIILGIFVKNCLNVFPDKKKVKSRDILAYKQFVAQIHEQSRTGGVMVSELASSVVDRGVEPRSGQTKDYRIGIGCFSVKHSALRRKSNDWLARNHDNVSECGDMSIRGLLFQWASTIRIQLSMLV